MKKKKGIFSRVVSLLLFSAACSGQGIAQSLPYQDSPFGVWDTFSGYGMRKSDIASMKDLGVHWEAVPVPPLLPSTWEDWKTTYQDYENSGINPVPMIDMLESRQTNKLSPAQYYNAIKNDGK